MATQLLKVGAMKTQSISIPQVELGGGELTITRFCGPDSLISAGEWTTVCLEVMIASSDGRTRMVAQLTNSDAKKLAAAIEEGMRIE